MGVGCPRCGCSWDLIAITWGGSSDLDKSKFHLHYKRNPSLTQRNFLPDFEAGYYRASTLSVQSAQECMKAAVLKQTQQNYLPDVEAGYYQASTLSVQSAQECTKVAVSNWGFHLSCNETNPKRHSLLPDFDAVITRGCLSPTTNQVGCDNSEKQQWLVNKLTTNRKPLRLR